MGCTNKGRHKFCKLQELALREKEDTTGGVSNAAVVARAASKGTMEAYVQMEKRGRVLKLVKVVDTRWSSWMHALARVLTLRDHIQRY